ncbi:MAG: NlpC/P60 family protein [Desulfobacteraceae bacterium]|jgi:lipoprotein Spr
MKETLKIQIVRFLILTIAAFTLASCSTRQAFSVVINERNAEAEIRKTAMHVDKRDLTAKPERPNALADLEDMEEEWDDQPFEMDETELSQTQSVILKEFNVWKGTPYRMGGNTMRGVDCSGFVKHIYNKLFSLDVPRSSREFMSTGQRIDKDELKPGDLIVFSPRSYPSHVGIYIGNNKFIHASRNRGVSMADLDQRYWKKAFRMARRLIVQ